MKFEYYAELVLAPFPLKELNKFGDDGWELVSITFAPQRGWYYCFKRPIGDGASNVPAVIAPSAVVPVAPTVAWREQVYLFAMRAWATLKGLYERVCSFVRGMIRRL